MRVLVRRRRRLARHWRLALRNAALTFGAVAFVVASSGCATNPPAPDSPSNPESGARGMFAQTAGAVIGGASGAVAGAAGGALVGALLAASRCWNIDIGSVTNVCALSGAVVGAFVGAAALGKTGAKWGSEAAVQGAAPPASAPDERDISPAASSPRIAYASALEGREHIGHLPDTDFSKSGTLLVRRVQARDAYGNARGTVLVNLDESSGREVGSVEADIVVHCDTGKVYYESRRSYKAWYGGGQWMGTEPAVVGLPPGAELDAVIAAVCRT